MSISLHAIGIASSGLMKQKLSFWAKLHFTCFSAERSTELTREYSPYIDKHGGGLIIFLGSFCSTGVGSLHRNQGTMKKEDYAQILSDCLRKYVMDFGLGRRWTFQKDNDPKQNSKLAKDWSKEHRIKVFQRP